MTTHPDPPSSTVPHAAPDGTQSGLGTATMRRALLSSFLGSAIEFYDFMLYATAASLVFGSVFFSQLSPGMALFASFGTMAAGYLSRPLGALIFGPIGDRHGRKVVLIATLLLMGVTSTLIGLLPTQAQVGALAPVLLVVLRVLQGIAVGGEWGGSMLVALEHAPGRRRGLAASVANMGGPTGAMAATSLLGLFAMLPEEDFYSWGWRIPFLLSMVLVLIGLFVRLKLAETPFYERAAARSDDRRTPVRDIFIHHRRGLMLGVLAGISPFVTQGVFVVWSTSFVVQFGMSAATAVGLHLPTAIGLVVAIALSSTLSDRFGRRPVMITGALTGIILAWPLLLLLQTGSVMGVLVAILIAQFVIQGFVFGPLAAFCAELFPTRVRYTGAGLIYALSSTLGAGFTPMLATAVWSNTNSVLVLAVSLMVVYAISAVAVYATSEGTRVSLDADDSRPLSDAALAGGDSARASAAG